MVDKSIQNKQLVAEHCSEWSWPETAVGGLGHRCGELFSCSRLTNKGAIMKKKSRQERFDDSIKLWALLAAYVGWIFSLGIVLAESTPTYIRWPLALLMIGSVVNYYYDQVK
jgi:hypothetical protein